MSNIIKNNSEGYGYNYASLSDIVQQGFTLPMMKTETDVTTGNEYVYYLDGDNWIRGARVVIPQQTKGMNEAQAYGSALTYARRYTTLMALSLACEDDKELETNNEKPTDKQIEFLKKLYTDDEINKIIEHYELNSINDLPKQLVSKYIDDRNGKK